jgi:hypothetical protein
MEMINKLLGIILFIGLFLSKSAFSIEITDRFNHRFQKEVILTCGESEYFCDDLCGKKDQCVIKEKVCRDCIGSTIYLTHVFDQIGRSIVAADEAKIEDMIELFRTKRFSILGPTSVYNMVDGTGNKDIERRFASLCPSEEYTHPIIIFETQEISNLLGKPKFLVCNNGENTKVFHVNPYGGVIIDPIL